MNSAINKKYYGQWQYALASIGRSHSLSLLLLGSSLSLLQAALLGAAGRRMQVKQVRPTLWDAAEEARARRAGLKSLRLGLLGGTLTDGGLNQLGRALRELQVSKVRSGGAWASRGQNPLSTPSP